MGLRVSGVLFIGVAMFGLMFQSFSLQSEATAAQTNSTAFDATRVLFTDLVGTGGGQFPMLAVVAFIAGALGLTLVFR